MYTNRLLLLAGGLLLIIGSRLPWISVPVLFGVEGPAYEAIEIGWEDNGILTGLFGLILLVVGALVKGRAGRLYSLPGGIFAAFAALVVAGCFLRILEIDPAAGFFAATDFGIYITLIGALLALTGALLKSTLNLFVLTK
jgi:hypothetical protein